MAEAFFDEDGPGETWQEFLGKARGWAGAAVSVALVAGVVFWGWRLAERDVSGVPVVRAMDGQYRVAPETPGGEEVPYQGLAVNRVAAGEGAAPPPAPDEVRLAPPPLGLAPEDVPAAPATRAGAEIPPVPDPASAATMAADPEPEPQPESEPAPAPAPKAVPVSIDRRVEAALRAAVARSEPAAAQAAVLTSTPDLPPPPRPVFAAEGADSAPPDLAPGTALVQIGALKTRDAARREWRRLAARAPDLFAGKRQLIVSTGGEDGFYRLRMAGFSGSDAAGRFCAALEAEGIGCIPVVSE